jgi:hypothetical protein
MLHSMALLCEPAVLSTFARVGLGCRICNQLRNRRLIGCIGIIKTLYN